MVSDAIPVCVVSGFLGAGKTSFLNRLLGHEGFARTAVIINEFGETGLDHLFIEGREDGIVELSNGCLCCTIRGELATTLDSLPRERIDRVIVETTGLADPGPVLQAVMAVPAYRHGGLVTLVDALNAPLQIERQEEARRQVALADLLIVTKLDMLEGADRESRSAEIRTLLRGLNPVAPVIDREQAALSPALIDGLGQAIVLSHDFESRHGRHAPHAHDHHHGHGHDVSRHGDDIRSLVLRHGGKLPRRVVEAFCELLGSAHSASLLRLKGLVAIEGEAGPLVIHGIHGVFHEPVQLDRWPDGDEATRIVVILQGMDPDFVRRLFAGFVGRPAVDTPDRAALMDNPLAIPGFRSV